MEITVHHLDNLVKVGVKGRLDNNWSEFFSKNLDDIIAGGAHDLRVDLSEVSFLSSAGIGVLVRYYKELRGIGGSFIVVRPSSRVEIVLRQVAMHSILCDEAREPPPAALVTVAQNLETETTTYDVYELSSLATLSCRVIGDPTPVFNAAFTRESCHELPSCRLALGLGALGNSFEDCRGRFGEFIAVEGATAYQPTEGTSQPDYLLCSEATQEVQVLYGVALEGSFRQLIRFESRKNCGPVSLSECVRRCLELNGGKTLGMVMIAEVAGLVGAALRCSPVEPTTASRFTYPTIGQWLSFTPERVLQRTIAVLVGIASQRPSPVLMPFLRPLVETGDLLGHFHAAVFSYLPMQRGVVQLRDAVRHVFEAQALVSVLHLLNDTRTGVGVGQSEFKRGACWVAEVSKFEGETV